MKIERNRKKVSVTTDFGLAVYYDGFSNVDITIGDDYSENIYGICGNQSGNLNDLVKPDKTVTTDGQEFANSWKVDKSCSDAIPPPDPCLNARESRNNLAKRKCAALSQSPFSSCHGEVKVNSYIKDCEYDVCGCSKHPLQCLCEAYASYATTCGHAGVDVKWKQKFTGECGKFMQGWILFSHAQKLPSCFSVKSYLHALQLVRSS